MIRNTLLCLSFILLTGLILRANPLPWPHESSDLSPDTEAIFGTLDNGLRYIILPHDEPPQRLSLRLYVEAGSLMEDEDQRGLAHFLEHMAFNGTEHFKPEEMVEYFQRLGMAFGADTNAHTSFGETVYKIELPEIKEQYLDDGLLVLRDYATGMLLPADQIEKERGIILAEKRARDSVGYRTMQAYWRFLLPHAKFGERFPIGIEEVIKSAPREEFVSFYETWYRPQNMALVVVGDIKPERAQSKIEEFFANMKKMEEPVPQVDIGEVQLRDKVRAGVHVEPEAEAADISIMSTRPYADVGDSAQRRKERIRREAAEYILTRRLEKLSRQEDAPFSRGTAYSFDYLQFFEMAGIDLVSRPEQWALAVEVAEHELRRALEHGFTQAEVAEAKAEILNVYEQAVETAPSRKSRELADGLVRSLRARMVWTNPQTELDLAREALAEASPDDLAKAFRAAWSSPNRDLFVSGDLDKSVTEKDVLLAYRTASKTDVEPPEEEQDVTFAYTDFGTAGKVVGEKQIEAVDVSQYDFANGVRLNFKPTDFEANKVRVGVRFGRGLLELPKDRPELGLIAELTFIAGGLEDHAQDELQRIFAGKTVGVSFSVGEDAFVLSGLTNAEDLRDQLNLMTAYLVSPGFREEALRQARKQLPEIYIQSKTTVEGVMSNEVNRFLHSGDPRFGLPPQERTQEVTLDEVQDWMRRALEKGALEVSVVGDVDGGTVVDAVSNTFGALPQRREQVLELPGAREVAFPRDAAGSSRFFSFESQIPRAAAATYWPTVPTQEIHTARRLGLLSDVFSDRLRVKLREEFGEAYSPFSFNRSSDVWKDYGILVAMAVVDPDKTESVVDLLRDISDDLAGKSITQDELERAQKPVLNMLEEYQRNNQYWLQRVLMGATVRPEQLDWAQSIQPDYASITVDELNEVAAEYLGADAGVGVIASPGENEE